MSSEGGRGPPLLKASREGSWENVTEEGMGTGLRPAERSRACVSYGPTFPLGGFCFVLFFYTGPLRSQVREQEDSLRTDPQT